MKPILLDLFCGAGGCAYGYQRAGFYVVGVDICPKPKYCGDAFFQGDALAVLDLLNSGGSFLASDGVNYSLSSFAVTHSSPPCQTYSALAHFATPGKHQGLVPQTREALNRTGKPYVIENVPGAPLNVSLVLCGTMFRLATPCGAELRRHRWFEMNWGLIDLVPPCDHGWSLQDRVISVHGDHARDRKIQRMCARSIMVVGSTARDPGMERRKYRPTKPRVLSVTGSVAQQNVVHNELRETFSREDAGIAMGIDWMGMKDLSQAIPPAYTEFIGKMLLAVL